MLIEQKIDKQTPPDLSVRSLYKSSKVSSISTGYKRKPGTKVDKAIENTSLIAAENTSNTAKSQKEFLTIPSGSSEAVLNDKKNRLDRDDLLLNDSKFKTLYDSLPSIAFTVSSDRTIYSINSFGAERLGYKPDDLIGQPFAILETGNASDMQRMEKIYQDCLEHPEKVHRWETSRCCKNGFYIFVWETARVIRNSNGDLYMSIACQEVTEMKVVIDEQMSAMTHDNLTGLINRQSLEQQINSLIKIGQNDYQEHALCHIDLDQFKIINDTCGHVAGDKLLFQIAKVLRGCVRQYDSVARVGGDEFAILFKNCTLDKAKCIASKILHTIATHNFIWDEQCLQLGASIGLVQIHMQNRNPTQILSAADSACNIAKEQGRDRIHTFYENDPEQIKRCEEMQCVAQINQALTENRFRLYYQVIKPVNAETTGSHFELLLRMIDEQGNIVPPSSFIPAAERYGLSTKLDRWVIRNAIEWLSSDIERIECLHRASINLSGCSIEDDDFIEFLINEITNCAVPASKICLELTETVAIANVSSAVKSMQRLKDLGCLIAIDDFGTGFSSFAYLKHLPIDVLKIDGIFVKDIMSNPTNLALVKSINEISHVVGKQTVAEFVETPEILEKLKQIGVDYAQGYALGLPTPILNSPKRI